MVGFISRPSIRFVTFGLIAALGIAIADALFFCRHSSIKSSPPLPSASAAYWDTLRRVGRGYSTNLLFPDGIPENEDFGFWLISTTNAFSRAFGVRAIVTTDRADSIPFLEWMERVHPDWTGERNTAFSNIAATPPYWATNRPARWTTEETARFTSFFRKRYMSERDFQCRLKFDRFFLRTDPDWKTSEGRLSYLERSLLLAPTESASNTLLRIIKERLEPVDVEAYERLRRMIVH